MQSEMIGTYFSHKKNRVLFTLLKLENELHEATFRHSSGNCRKEKSENQLKEKKLSLESVSVSRTLAESLN